MGAKGTPFHSLVAPDENHQMTVLIQKGCEFEGKLCFEGTAKIDGRFKGKIFTKDILIIGEGAVVEGDIEADVVIIYGNMFGKITALNRIELRYPGVFKGDYFTPVFSMDEGAIHQGRAHMVKDPGKVQTIFSSSDGESDAPVSN
jgi:cytoskeletal protein CcmA (bactofilin family)